MKIRFVSNQIGVNVEYHAHGDWRSAGLFSHETVAGHGGLANFKTKALYSLYPASNMQQEVTPPGTYHEENQTITCI